MMNTCHQDLLTPNEKNSFVVALAPLTIIPDLHDLVSPVITKFGYKPIKWLHITLAVFKKIDMLESVCEGVQNISLEIKKFNLKSSELHVFKKQHVVCLKLEKNPELISIRKKIHASLQINRLLTSIFNIFWIPHISIAYTENNDYMKIYRNLLKLRIDFMIEVEAFSIRDLFTYNRIMPLG